MGGPQFATVTFLLDGGAEGGTFRVPISDETSVRRLAKDAMQRLLARRGDEHQHFTPANISVSEVFVGGGTHRAEIFAQDLVTQVVLVKEEVVFMQLRMKASAAPAETCPPAACAVKAAVESGAAVGAVPQEEKSRAEEAPKLPVTRSESPNALTVADRSPNAIRARPDGLNDTTATTNNNNKKNNNNVKNSNDGVKAHQIGVVENHVESNRAKRQAGKRSREEAEAKGNNENAPETVGRTISTRTSSRGLGWGPEAHKSFAFNYVASPNKLMRRCAPRPKNSEPSKPVVDVAKKAAEPTPKEAPDVEQVLPPGWGPQAGKYFAVNYVSSPDRLARDLRIARRNEEEKKKKKKEKEEKEEKEKEEEERPKHNTSGSTRRSGVLLPHSATPATQPAAPARPAAQEKTPQPAEVERRLSYDIPDNARTPVGQSSRELTGSETRPAGWGREADRFFDKDTYCDNPAKARLSLELLQRPVRARREIVLPSYFSVLDK